MPRPLATPLADLPPLTPADARRILQARLDADWTTWITSEPINGSRRARRRWNRTLAQSELLDQLKRDELRSIAALPDPDLAWLLAVGWRPEHHHPDVDRPAFLPTITSTVPTAAETRATP